VFDVTASLAMIVAAGTVVWLAISDRSGSGSATPRARTAADRAAELAAIPATPLSLERAIIEGSDVAPLALIEFSDFQCKFCAEFAQGTLPGLRDNYIATGKLLYAVRQAPRSAESPYPAAAWCAHEQGKFQAVQDGLFKRPSPAEIEAYMQSAGVELSTWRECLTGVDVKSAMRLDRDETKALGVRGTPTFFLGRLTDGRVHVIRKFLGSQKMSELQDAIDAALAVRGTM
jgi:protein-disulfide isomerase